MSLLDFQIALGRAVRASPGKDPLGGLNLALGERDRLAALIESPGFRFTKEVQRSWSKGRASKAAELTLSVLPPEERDRLLEAWISNGGGTASFFALEADAFLEFLAGQLPDPSHALTLCRVEQAALRASEGSGQFTAPDLARLDAPGSVLRVGKHAALVRFHAEPRLLLAAVMGQPLPPLSPHVTTMLFGPGLEGLFREATGDEVALWERLHDPVRATTLLREGHRHEPIEALLLAGGAEFLDSASLGPSRA